MFNLGNRPVTFVEQPSTGMQTRHRFEADIIFRSRTMVATRRRHPDSKITRIRVLLLSGQGVAVVQRMFYDDI